MSRGDNHARNHLSAIFTTYLTLTINSREHLCLTDYAQQPTTNNQQDVYRVYSFLKFAKLIKQPRPLQYLARARLLLQLICDVIVHRDIQSLVKSVRKSCARGRTVATASIVPLHSTVFAGKHALRRSLRKLMLSVATYSRSMKSNPPTTPSYIKIHRLQADLNFLSKWACDRLLRFRIPDFY